MTPQEVIRESYQDHLDITAWMIDPAELAEAIELLQEEGE